MDVPAVALTPSWEEGLGLPSSPSRLHNGASAITETTEASGSLTTNLRKQILQNLTFETAKMLVLLAPSSASDIAPAFQSLYLV